MELNDDEVRRFADACSDLRNEVARQIMAAVGANSASGVLARLLLAHDGERERLLDLIRLAIEGERSA